RAHEVGRQALEHGAAGLPRDHAGREDPQADRRQDVVLPGADAPGGEQSEEQGKMTIRISPDQEIGKLTPSRGAQGEGVVANREKMTIRIRPDQKLGMLTPSRETTVEV